MMRRERASFPDGSRGVLAALLLALAATACDPPPGADDADPPPGDGADPGRAGADAPPEPATLWLAWAGDEVHVVVPGLTLEVAGRDTVVVPDSVAPVPPRLQLLVQGRCSEAVGAARSRPSDDPYIAERTPVARLEQRQERVDGADLFLAFPEGACPADAPAPLARYRSWRPNSLPEEDLAALRDAVAALDPADSSRIQVMEGGRWETAAGDTVVWGFVDRTPADREMARRAPGWLVGLRGPGGRDGVDHAAPVEGFLRVWPFVALLGPVDLDGGGGPELVTVVTTPSAEYSWTQELRVYRRGSDGRWTPWLRAPLRDYLEAG